jgi:hypothetical protein
MATPRTREPAPRVGETEVGDDANGAAAPQRAIGVLDQARALLGPSVVPALSGDEAADDATL